MPLAAPSPQTRPPLRRMLFIHDQLKREQYPDCLALCAAMEVGSRRTILRDITFMRDQLRLPITFDRQRGGYGYTRPVKHFPGIAVSEAELFAILVAQKAIAHYEGTPFHGPLQTAFEKLSADLDAETVVNLQSLGDAMDIRVSGLEDLSAETFQMVTRAVQTRRPLKFRYRKHAARHFEVRSLLPYQLVCANQRWYVIGLDTTRQAIREFVLARVRDPELLPGTFTRPADFHIEDFLKSSFGIFRGKDDYEVVIEFDRWAGDVMRGRRWHPSQELTELPTGELRMVLHLDSLEEVEPWVLSWGVHATVLRPRRLADRLLAAARGIQQTYAPPVNPDLPATEASPSLPNLEGG